jgi:hypothetical protein
VSVRYTSVKLLETSNSLKNVQKLLFPVSINLKVCGVRLLFQCYYSINSNINTKIELIHIYFFNKLVVSICFFFLNFSVETILK